MRPVITFNPTLEQKIKAIALTYLEKGKPLWDVAHTLKTVEYAKELIKHEGGNAKVLITAAYLLNIGYGLTDIAKKEMGFVTVLRYKRTHAVLGSKEAEKILKQTGKFTEEEIKEISRLVYIHDEWWSNVFKDFEKDFNDFIITEADTLGMLDPSLPQNFSDEDKRKFLDESVIPFRSKLFRTEYGKAKFKELLQAILKQLK